MRTNASTRLFASEDWWDQMTSEQKKEYVEQHPNSKYAKEHIDQDDEESNQGPASTEERKALASSLRKAVPEVASKIKKAFPKMNAAASALKHLATGKKLDEEHKEVLHELGGVALKVASSHLVGDPHLGKVLKHVGTHAVHYAIDKFKEHKEKNKNKDDLEVFVDGIVEGVENVEESKSETKQSIASHIKKSAGHVVEILNRSFKDIKPATSGLKALAQGQPLDPEHKKALKGLGKVALATSVAALPGGLVVHLGAGVGATALVHAFKKMRGYHGGHVVHHFVESIGEGLEDALLEHAAGEGEHGE